MSHVGFRMPWFSKSRMSRTKPFPYRSSRTSWWTFSMRQTCEGAASSRKGRSSRPSHKPCSLLRSAAGEPAELAPRHELQMEALVWPLPRRRRRRPDVLRRLPGHRPLDPVLSTLKSHHVEAAARFNARCLGGCLMSNADLAIWPSPRETASAVRAARGTNPSLGLGARGSARAIPCYQFPRSRALSSCA